MMTETAYRICPLCEAGCGLTVTTCGREILAVRGDDDDGFSHGYLCPKGVALKDLHEDPDRLRVPLVKRGGRHHEASWDEAWRLIAERLPPIIAARGHDAVATYLGNPTGHALGCTTGVAALFAALKTRNRYSASSLDQLPRQYVCGAMYGSWTSMTVPDIDRCDCLMVIGGNPLVSNGSLWMVPDFRHRAQALRARGGRLVVIDPRRSETARIADTHHFIRPGTDAWLLLAMLQTVFAEGLAAPGAAVVHLAGYDELPGIVAGFTPERAAARCDVSAPVIRALARRLATTRRAALYGRTGTNMQRHGALASWLIEVLNIVTGHLDTEGGMQFGRPAAFGRNTQGAPGRGRGVIIDRYRTRVRGLPEIATELPAAALAEEIETPGPGQIRALITVAGNPVLSAPNGRRLDAALGRLEFMVSVDLYLNATTRHADVVLPGTPPFEKSHYDTFLGPYATRNVARYSPAVFAPEAGRPDEHDILLGLAAIIAGQGIASPAMLRAMEQQTLGRMIEQAVADPASSIHGRAPAEIRARMASAQGPEVTLEFLLRTGPWGDGFGRAPQGLTLERLRANPHGIDLGALAPRLPEVLRTPSGKIEMCLPGVARAIEALGDDAEPGPAGLLLIGRRHLQTNNSWMRNLPTLAKGPSRCTLLVNPVDAVRLGLANGAEAVVRSRIGEVRAPVEVSDEIMAGVVSLPHGFGVPHPDERQRLAAKRPGVNSNLLADDAAVDTLTGTAVFNGIPVEVRGV